MPKQPELLKSSTALIPISLAENEVKKIIVSIEGLVGDGDIEEAIQFCSELCFNSPFAVRSLDTRRYVLKRLWIAIDEYHMQQFEKRLQEQIRHLASYEREDVEFASFAEEEAVEDMRQANRFSRRLGRCEVLFETMHKDQRAFTPQGLEMLAHLLTQSEDGA